MPLRGAEARRRKGPHDTETWRRQLEAVGIDYGSSATLPVPIYSAGQLARAADVLDKLADSMRRTLAMHRWTERAQVSRCVRLIHSARHQLRLTHRPYR